MLRFTIRDVLWLTVVVGLGIGWWQAQHRRADQEFRLMHLRENFEDVTAIGKDSFGMITKGDAEQGQVTIEFHVSAKKRPANLSGVKDTAAK